MREGFSLVSSLRFMCRLEQAERSKPQRPASVWGWCSACGSALLGTGTVMVPWAIVCLVQGRQLRAIGLLCIFGAALLVRTTLEPRLVGRHLGLDPLVTLVFLYLGYRFWGIPGMLLAPMLVAAVTAAADKSQAEQ